MIKDIRIHSSEDLTVRVGKMWGSANHYVLSYVFPMTISPGIGKPAFIEDEQAEYLKELNLPKPDTYLIYIGSDVEEKKERWNGVELPADVLDDFEDFNREVIYKIRNVVKSSMDN